MIRSSLLLASGIGLGAALLLSSCGQKPQQRLKETIPQDAIVVAHIADFASYLELYPEDAIQGSLALQKLSLQQNGGAVSEDKFEDAEKAAEIIFGLMENFDGEFAFFATAPEDLNAEGAVPSVQLLASYAGTAATIDDAFAKMEEAPEAVAGETYGAYAFQTRELDSDFTLHYAVADGMLVAGNDFAALKTSIDVLGGTPLSNTIESAATYQKAISHSKGYDGGILFAQLTDSIREQLKASLIEDGSPEAIDILGLDSIQGLFLSYPQGAAAQSKAVGGLLYDQPAGFFKLFAKPDSEIQLPAWASTEAYLNMALQIDFPTFKDGFLELAEISSPGTREQYEQTNQQALMFIGITIDDLLSKVLGDQITYSVTLKDEVSSNAYVSDSNQLESMLLAIELQDRAQFEAILDKISQQAGGMIQKQARGEATFISSPMPIPGIGNGLQAALAITDDTLFVAIGGIERLEAILTEGEVPHSGAFAESTVDAAVDGSLPEVFTAISSNFSSFTNLVRGMMETKGEELSDAERADLEAYLAFMEKSFGRLAIAGRQTEGAMLFTLEVGN